jgi:hypothetical protein
LSSSLGRCRHRRRAGWCARAQGGAPSCGTWRSAQEYHIVRLLINCFTRYVGCAG